MRHDLFYSLRVLAKSRGFTALAVAILAIGIGINTALFSVAYAIFFRPLPVHAAHELVYLYWIGGMFREPRPSLPRYPDYEYFRDHPEAFSGVTAHWSWSTFMQVDDLAERVRGEVVFANYFDVLGVSPILGRTFGPEDDDVTRTGVPIVISHSLWTRRFEAAPDVIGRRVRLSDSATRDATIVGVMPAGFNGVSDPWTPSQCWITFAHQFGNDTRRIAVAPIARLRPGVSVRQAQAIVTAQGRQLSAARGGREKDRFLVFAANSVRMPFRPTESIAPRRLTVAMTAVVGVVLLVSVANIAGMLMARGVTRSGELAVRLALGASGWRVARQLLLEGMLLTTLAGVLGLLVAQWLIELFRRYTPERFAVSVWLDAGSWLFTAVLCAILGLLVGVAPAFQGARVNLAAALPGCGSGARQEVRGRLRYGVVIPQLALSLVLLLVATIHVRGLLAVELTDLGYDTRNTAVLTVGLLPIPGQDSQPAVRGTWDAERSAKYAERRRAFYRELRSRLRSAPGGTEAAMASGLPVRHPAQARSNYVALSQDAFVTAGISGPGVETIAVSPDYFRVMGMSLIAGRDFDDRDGERTPRVAIISQSLASRLWPGRSPLGQSLAAVSAWNGPNQRIEWMEVVGVVNEVLPVLQEHGATPYVYLPLSQQWQPEVSRVIARSPDAVSIVPGLKAAVGSADSFGTVYRTESLKQLAADILYPRRLAASILGASAMVALLLASAGLYGVVSYSVAQRVHEIGVRAALGADRRDILRLIVFEGLKVGVLGACVGLALSYAAVRFSSNLFVGMPRADAVTLLAVPVALLAIVLLASYIPARRAARVDPVDALRAL